MTIINKKVLLNTTYTINKEKRTIVKNVFKTGTLEPCMVSTQMFLEFFQFS